MLVTSQASSLAIFQTFFTKKLRLERFYYKNDGLKIIVKSKVKYFEINLHAKKLFIFFHFLPSIQVIIISSFAWVFHLKKKYINIFSSRKRTRNIIFFFTLYFFHYIIGIIGYVSFGDLNRFFTESSLCYNAQWKKTKMKSFAQHLEWDFYSLSIGINSGGVILLKFIVTFAEGQCSVKVLSRTPPCSKGSKITRLPILPIIFILPASTKSISNRNKNQGWNDREIHSRNLSDESHQ